MRHRDERMFANCLCSLTISAFFGHHCLFWPSLPFLAITACFGHHCLFWPSLPFFFAQEFEDMMVSSMTFQTLIPKP